MVRSEVDEKKGPGSAKATWHRSTGSIAAPERASVAHQTLIPARGTPKTCFWGAPGGGGAVSSNLSSQTLRIESEAADPAPRTVWSRDMHRGPPPAALPLGTK